MNIYLANNKCSGRANSRLVDRRMYWNQKFIFFLHQFFWLLNIHRRTFIDLPHCGPLRPSPLWVCYLSRPAFCFCIPSYLNFTPKWPIQGAFLKPMLRDFGSMALFFFEPCNSPFSGTSALRSFASLIHFIYGHILVYLMDQLVVLHPFTGNISKRWS